MFSKLNPDPKPAIDVPIYVTEAPDGKLSLYALEGTQTRCVGTFDNPGAAWAALDELEQVA
jgi:hypothetical protein